MALPSKLAESYCKFRTCDVKLPVEYGRCENEDIRTNRRKLLSRYYFERPNILKSHTVFNYVTENELISLIKL